MKSMLVHRKYYVPDLVTFCSIKLFYCLAIITVSKSVAYGATAIPTESIDKELILTQKEKLVLDQVRNVLKERIVK